MKMHGTMFARDNDGETQFILVPADGATTEFRRIDECPPEVQKVISDMADATDGIPLGVIVDLGGQA